VLVGNIVPRVIISETYWRHSLFTKAKVFLASRGRGQANSGLGQINEHKVQATNPNNTAPHPHTNTPVTYMNFAPICVNYNKTSTAT
jgi:hypothetical protein